MIAELETVVLVRDAPEHGLTRGDAGAVVMVLADGAAYMVEFVTLGGATVALATLPASALRPVTARDLIHVREVA